MKVAVISSLYPTPKHPTTIGGAEVFAKQLAEGLVAAGDEVVVIRTAPTSIQELEVANGVAVNFIPVRNLYPPFEEKRNALLRTAWHLIDDWNLAHPSIAEILAGFKPDVVHSNTINGLSAGVWRVAAARTTPIVHTLHDYYLVCPRCARFRRGHSCGKTCGSCALLSTKRRALAELVDTVVGVSQRVLDIHLECGLFSSATQRVVRNVPNPAIEASPQPSLDGPLKLGYLGRFAEEKGVGLLVEAVGMLAPGTVQLVMAGSVSEAERARLRSLAPSADLKFVGFVAPSGFYAGVDVVAVPSIWEEPGALALVDALAAGRPAIGTTFGGITEMLEDEVTGWLAKPDAGALAAVIRNLAENRPLIQKAHEALLQRHQPRTLVDLVGDYRQTYQFALEALSGSGLAAETAR